MHQIHTTTTLSQLIHHSPAQLHVLSDADWPVTEMITPSTGIVLFSLTT